MKNQLLLAQMLAEGTENMIAVSNFLPVLTGALITLIGSLLVAWWNGRKADRQMDFSKRSKPPELARYKELLEISKEYKELVNFENVDALAIVSPEYREIEGCRKIALERLAWEHKVLSECRDIQARKRLLKIPESYIVGQWMGDIKIFPSFNTILSVFLQVILYIFMIAMSIRYGIECIKLAILSFQVIVNPEILDGERQYMVVLIPALTLFLTFMSIFSVRTLYVVIKPLGNAISSGEIARYEYIKILQKYAPKNICENLDALINSPAKAVVRLGYAMFDSEYAALVNVPKIWRRNKWYIPPVKILMAAVPYALLEKFNKSGKPYGSYLEGAFEIDAKNLEGKELSAQGKAASDKEDKESVDTKAESKS